MRVLPKGWGIHVGRDPEREARRLKSRFQKISRRYERAIKLRRYLLWARWAALAALLSFAVTWGFLKLSPWNPTLTFKHLAAMPSCGMARAVGLAPAYYDGPGYWQWHDADRDGRSCE